MVAETLQQHAAELAAGLIVRGAYGHSRLWAGLSDALRIVR